MYCIAPVEAENEEAIHLVEGEKVFVIGNYQKQSAWKHQAI